MSRVVYLLFALGRVLGVAQTKISSDVISFIDTPTGAECDRQQHSSLCKQKLYVHPLRSALFNNAVRYWYYTASVIYDWKFLKFCGLFLNQQKDGLRKYDLGSDPNLHVEKCY
jgi:hypothetical protein